MAPTDLLTRKTVAQMLGVSPYHLRRLDHELKPLHVEGGFRVYPRANVDRALARRQETPPRRGRPRKAAR